MGSEQAAGGTKGLSRRDLLRTAAAAGTGLVLSRVARGAATPKPADLNLALLGAGSQGHVLLIPCLKMEGIRVKAVCDIWPYRQTYTLNILRKFDQQANAYADYQEMLEKEKDIDAVLIATPDWVHAEQAIACLKAGKHVYCEKEMSNTIENCKKMVLAARETGKLLQIGHQRRSNPRYLHALKMITKDKILGRITHTYGQWNRPVTPDLGWPEKHTMDKATREKYGYDTMHRLRNWRWFRKFSGGAIADLGSHQIDVFSWFLGAQPKAVVAMGGLDYYKDREWYDNVMAIYQYGPQSGTVRGFYEVVNSTSFGGYYEAFMGDEGTLVLSEDTNIGYIMREVRAKKREWEDDAAKVSKMGKDAIELKIGETRRADGKKDAQSLKMAADLQKPIHQPHLENFFDAIRSGTPLNCPPEVAYETAVTVLRVNEAVAEGKRMEFKPEDFKV
jgi:predicted dehydrogenase